MLFTELKDSADIYLLPPSRKGLKRIPADLMKALPRLPSLNRRLQQNVAEVARAGLLQHLLNSGRCMAKSDLDRSASEARVFLMKRELKLK